MLNIAPALIWVQSDPTTHFTEIIKATSEEESLQISDGGDLWYNCASAANKQFMIEAVILKVISADVAAQDFDLFFYCDSNFANVDTSVDTCVGFVSLTQASTQKTALGVANLYYYADHDIQLPYFDKEKTTLASGPRLHVLLSASDNDLLAADTLCLCVGLRPLQ